MTLVAQLYMDKRDVEGRSAERIAAGRGATLRDAVHRPIDIVIEDLSATGFGMSTMEDFSIGSILNLRLAGINKRDVRIVRRFGLQYGCEFAPPLSELELTLALNAGSVVDASFTVSEEARPARLRGAKLAPPIRAGVLFGTIALLWVAIIFAVDLLLQH